MKTTLLRLAGVLALGSVLSGAAVAGTQERDRTFAKLQALIEHFRKQRRDRARWETFASQAHRRVILADGIIREADDQKGTKRRSNRHATKELTS